MTNGPRPTSADHTARLAWRAGCLRAALGAAGVAALLAGGAARAGDADAPAAPAHTVAPGPIAGRLPTSIPVRRDVPAEPSTSSVAVRSALFVALLAAGGVVLVRRRRALAPGAPAPAAGARRRWWAPSSAPGAVRVVHSTRLTSRASLHVVEWRGREWLLGCTDHAVTVLGDQADAPRPSPAARPPDPEPR